MADFTRLCGTPQPYSWAYHAIRTHFEDGGAFIRLGRAVGAGATKGAFALHDRAASPGLVTLNVTAASEGSWSSQVGLTVADGLVAGTFDLTVALADGSVVEIYRGLTTPAAAAAALTASVLVDATDAASVTAAPNNNPKVGVFALTAGTDDRASLAAADLVDVLDDLFPPELGTGIVSIPGYDSSTVGAGVLAHCQANSRIGVLHTPIGASQAAAKAAAAALVTAGAPGSFLTLVWPWVTYSDNGVSYTVPPDGFYAAGRTSAILAEGVWRAAAGALTRSKFLTGVEAGNSVGSIDGDALDDAHVTVIRVIAGRPEVYGARSLSTDAADWDLLKYRDLVNFVAVQLGAAVEDLEFGTVDGQGRYLASLAGAIRGVLAPMAGAGAFYPRVDAVSLAELDPGYAIDVSATVNTPTLLAQGKVAALVTIRPSPSATGINILLTKAALTASL